MEASGPFGRVPRVGEVEVQWVSAVWIGRVVVVAGAMASTEAVVSCGAVVESVVALASAGAGALIEV